MHSGEFALTSAQENETDIRIELQTSWGAVFCDVPEISCQGAEIHVYGGNIILVTTGDVLSFASVYPDSCQLSPQQRELTHTPSSVVPDPATARR